MAQNQNFFGQNPFADAWKALNDFQPNNADLNELNSAARRTFESIVAANRALAEGAQAIQDSPRAGRA